MNKLLKFLLFLLASVNILIAQNTSMPPIKISSSDLPYSVEGYTLVVDDGGNSYKFYDNYSNNPALNMINNGGIRIDMSGLVGKLETGKTYNLSIKITPGREFDDGKRTPNSIFCSSSSVVIHSPSSVSISNPAINIDGTTVGQIHVENLYSLATLSLPIGGSVAASIGSMISSALTDIFVNKVIDESFEDYKPSENIEVENNIFSNEKNINEVRWILGGWNLNEMLEAKSVNLSLPVKFTKSGKNEFSFYFNLWGEHSSLRRNNLITTTTATKFTPYSFRQHIVLNVDVEGDNYVEVSDPVPDEEPVNDYLNIAYENKIVKVIKLPKKIDKNNKEAIANQIVEGTLGIVASETISTITYSIGGLLFSFILESGVVGWERIVDFDILGGRLFEPGSDLNLLISVDTGDTSLDKVSVVIDRKDGFSWKFFKELLLLDQSEIISNKLDIGRFLIVLKNPLSAPDTTGKYRINILGKKRQITIKEKEVDNNLTVINEESVLEYLRNSNRSDIKQLLANNYDILKTYNKLYNSENKFLIFICFGEEDKYSGNVKTIHGFEFIKTDKGWVLNTTENNSIITKNKKDFSYYYRWYNNFKFVTIGKDNYALVTEYYDGGSGGGSGNYDFYTSINGEIKKIAELSSKSSWNSSSDRFEGTNNSFNYETKYSFKRNQNNLDFDDIVLNYEGTGNTDMIGKEEIYRYDKVKKEYILFKEIEKPVENNSHKGLIDMVFIESSIFGTKGKVVSADNYYIGKYEVTQSQYKSVMNFNPSQFRGDDLPVESVTLNDAIEFCNKLSEMEGLKKCYNRSECDLSANGYRLPTQDEWSGAVLGGGNKYSGSNDINEVAWYNKNSIRKTHSVGQKKPNEKGIYDMTGNVWEMCWDIWDDGDNSRKSRRNKKINRLMCGGGYSDGASNCRIGISSGFSSENKKKDIGFRVVRTADK